MPTAAGAGNSAAAASQPHRLTPLNDEEDDDFQNPCTLSTQSQLAKSIRPVISRKPLRPSNSPAAERIRSKRPRRSQAARGKENAGSGNSVSRSAAKLSALSKGSDSNSLDDSVEDLGLDSINPCTNFSHLTNEENLQSELGKGCILAGDLGGSSSLDLIDLGIDPSSETQINEVRLFDSETGGAFLCNSTESRLITDRLNSSSETSSGFDQDARVSTDLSNGHHIDNCNLHESCSLDMIEPSIECTDLVKDGNIEDYCGKDTEKRVLESKGNGTYLVNSIESRLVAGGKLGCDDKFCNEGEPEDLFEKFESGPEFDVLFKLCTDGDGEVMDIVYCPLCGVDISDLNEESRQVHTNECLDKEERFDEVLARGHHDGTSDSLPSISDGSVPLHPGQVVDVNPVLGWLRSLGLEKYEEAFIREEIDWDSLQWLSEEDLCNIGINALGPRKKIMHALHELRKGDSRDAEDDSNANGKKIRKNSSSEVIVADNTKSAPTKLITDYFLGSFSDQRIRTSSIEQEKVKEKTSSTRKSGKQRNDTPKRKNSVVPVWCSIPGTPFRVDAFKYLRRDCSHWFLTHFHMDHYQGLTKSFCHGMIYCSEITAKLVNMKIGIPWDNLQVLPLNKKINIAGIDVTCFDANHCPGSILILFEPPNGESVLHTGDFRFSEEMAENPLLQASRVHTLILDTTYCQTQYNFPKQEAVVQFVLEAIQAEAFNPKTLFLIGSYTIGKERIFLEVARVLRKKVFVGAAKLRILKCFGYAEEDMQWLTDNEQESHIHVVPMWMLASLKRLKQISNQYLGRFSLIVAFSPTGWSFGKGKKKGTGRRWQQGTIIRYEVPYSEHCSFTELKEFVKFISPVNIIPSVNNDGPDSANTMISILSS